MSATFSTVSKSAAISTASRPLAAAVACGALLLALLWQATPTAASVSRYLDRGAATQLAEVLDKGVFRGKLISSTFIKSAAPGDYFITVALDNGGEQHWDLHQIRLWSLDNTITLSKNRVLVFPREDSNEFGVLDKNVFAQEALQARVYAKRFKAPDPLEGRVIHFAIHRFNLVGLSGENPARDRLGHPYHYVLDLENGQRELLTYLDAWEIHNRGGLMADPGDAPVLVAPYKLQRIEVQRLTRIVENGSGRFAVDLFFDRAIQLNPADFPFRLYELKRSATQKTVDNQFVLEIAIPNTIIPSPVNGFEALEYLNRIHVTADETRANRALLRTSITPEVLTTPPEVEVRENVVSVIFTKVDDQSVFDRRALDAAKLRRSQERLLASTLTDEEAQRRHLFRQHMETGLAQLDRARAEIEPVEGFEQLLAALANFREAAVHASSDMQLEDALRERNLLAEQLPSKVLRHVAEQGAPKGAQLPRFRQVVASVLGLTQKPGEQESLQKLATGLGGG